MGEDEEDTLKGEGISTKTEEEVAPEVVEEEALTEEMQASTRITLNASSVTR